MKALHTLLLCLLTVLLTLWFSSHWSSSESQTTQESLFERVEKAGKIRCAYIVWPPEFNKDPNTGQFSGMAYDITTELFGRLNIDVEWTEEVSFATMSEGLKNDRYDAVCFTLYRDNRRAKVAEMSTPIFYSGTGIYVRDNDDRFDNQDVSIFNDPNITISTIDGEMSEIVSKERFPKAQTLSLPQLSSPADMLMNVATGKADVTFANNIVATSFIKNNPGQIRNIQEDNPLLLFGHSLAFQKGAHDLVSSVNVVLEEMLNHGIIDIIIDKYPSKKNAYYRVKSPI